MIGFAIQFLIFCVVVVIVILLVQWVSEKAGVAIDPKLRMIIGLIIFLVLLVVFLNFVGAFDAGSIFRRH